MVKEFNSCFYFKVNFLLVNMDSDGFVLLSSSGLSKYEANIVLSLAKYGPMSIRDLCFVSKVPRTKVYSVIKKLSEKGIITVEVKDGGKIRRWGKVWLVDNIDLIKEKYLEYEINRAKERIDNLVRALERLVSQH